MTRFTIFEVTPLKAGTWIHVRGLLNNAAPVEECEDLMVGALVSHLCREYGLDIEPELEIVPVCDGHTRIAAGERDDGLRGIQFITNNPDCIPVGAINFARVG